MKRVVASVALVVCLVQSGPAVFAQTVSGQCFAIGDIAGQVASWRAHKKTKAEALAQAKKYYKNDADRQAVIDIIDKVYGTNGPLMTPDQASMLFTEDCAKRQKEQASKQ